MMCAEGLAKLIEECGELQQVCGKKLAYFTTDDHPDGGSPLRQRLENEMADVMAAIWLVTLTLGLDAEAIGRRASEKKAQFLAWHARTDNNEHAIDAPRKASVR